MVLTAQPGFTLSCSGDVQEDMLGKSSGHSNELERLVQGQSGLPVQ